MNNSFSSYEDMEKRIVNAILMPPSDENSIKLSMDKFKNRINLMLENEQNEKEREVLLSFRMNLSLVEKFILSGKRNRLSCKENALLFFQTVSYIRMKDFMYRLQNLYVR